MPNRNGSNVREVTGNIVLILMAIALFLYTIGQVFDLWWFAIADWAKLQGKPDVTGINNKKDLMEASFYLSQIALLGVAVIAGWFAYGQFREAGKSRLVDVYISMDEKWTSPAMMESRRLMHDIVNQCLRDERYKTQMRSFPSIEARRALQDFAHEYLSTMIIRNYDTYLKTMAIVEFIETLGMMVRQGYLKPNDIEPLIGMITVAINDIIEKHISTIVNRNRRIYLGRGLPRAPDDYENFMFLAGHFRTRFS